ncbi:MAG: O-antigen ligase family protein [Anaerolineales bacterium]
MTSIRRAAIEAASRYDRVIWWLWVSLLVTIPFTSFPLVARVMKGSTVNPLSAVPMAAMIGIWLLRKSGSRLAIPRFTIPLLLFALAAVLSSALASFLGISPFKGQSYVGRELRSVFTLATGLGFYFAPLLVVSSRKKLRASLRWVYVGAVLTLGWSTLQATQLGSPPRALFDSLQVVHRMFSLRDMLPDRVTGLAFEPSWLADQLVILYIPLGLATVVRGYSVFGRKSSWRSLELVILVWASLILFLTFSRIGMLAFISLLLVLAVLIGGKLKHAIVQRSAASERQMMLDNPWKGRLRLLQWPLILAMILGASVLAVFIASRIDVRIAKIFETDYASLLQGAKHPLLYSLAARLAYAERLMYWIAGLRTFSLYPVLGVGLGNSGFFFLETVPYFGSYLPEVLAFTSPAFAQFPNTKSLWVRLLAETGIIGFVLFAVWLSLLAATAWSLQKRDRGVRGVVALGALFTLGALIVEGFSLDTFALPQLWIALGVFTAAQQITEGSAESP